MHAIYSGRGFAAANPVFPRASKAARQRPEAGGHAPAPAASPSPKRASNPGDWRLRLAVDDLLKEHNNNALGHHHSGGSKKNHWQRQRRRTIARRDSYSTISTLESDPDTSRMVLPRLAERPVAGGGTESVPVEIRFPSPPGSSLEDTPEARGSWDDPDDIVFVPAGEHLASGSSSLDTVRTTSRRLPLAAHGAAAGSDCSTRRNHNNNSNNYYYTDTNIDNNNNNNNNDDDDDDDNRNSFHNSTRNSTHNSNSTGNHCHRRQKQWQRPSRQPSMGIASAGPPPPRPAMHQLSIRPRTRFEI
ncbi:unnamed protein product [Pseudo-nitzschia multistriata]|uniref:Uncharacterized protein n=1 Tax=Pseudo-nitzschia multistriata TaxID=183589 RepID=A0A448Z5I4_9STRA|nr:unnamed protein product [Pseudo-nitzschia multistriata]